MSGAVVGDEPGFEKFEGIEGFLVNFGAKGGDLKRVDGEGDDVGIGGEEIEAGGGGAVVVFGERDVAGGPIGGGARGG